MREKVTEFVPRQIRYAIRLALRPRTIMIRGVRLNVHQRHISARMKRCMYAENYENIESMIVIDEIQPTDRVLEIGAGIGFISTMCAQRIVAPGNVKAVEANPTLLQSIRETYSLNSVDVDLVHAAVVPGREEEVDFHIAEDFVSSSSRQERAMGVSVRVPALSLPNLIAEYQPTFLIMDIEGGEVGLFDNIDLSGVRAICIELHPSVVGHDQINELVQQLLTYGFIVDYDVSAHGSLLLKHTGS